MQSFLFPKENITAADSSSPPHLEEVDSTGHLMSSLWLRTLLFPFGWSTACAELPYFMCLTLKSCLGFLLWCKMHRTSKANKQSLRDFSIEERREKQTLFFMENLRAENTVPRTERLKSYKLEIILLSFHNRISPKYWIKIVCDDCQNKIKH